MPASGRCRVAAIGHEETFEKRSKCPREPGRIDSAAAGHLNFLSFTSHEHAADPSGRHEASQLEHADGLLHAREEATPQFVQGQYTRMRGAKTFFQRRQQ
jgi:hypothetical protein